MALWPDSTDLGMWIGNSAISPEAGDDMLGVIEAATEFVLNSIDLLKLPVDESCPASVRQAILIKGAELLGMKDAPTIGASVADVAIDRLLAPWRVDPEP